MQSVAQSKQVEPTFRKLVSRFADKENIRKIRKTGSFYEVQFNGRLSCVVHRQLTKRGFRLVNVYPVGENQVDAHFERGGD